MPTDTRQWNLLLKILECKNLGKRRRGRSTNNDIAQVCNKIMDETYTELNK